MTPRACVVSCLDRGSVRRRAPPQSNRMLPAGCKSADSGMVSEATTCREKRRRSGSGVYENGLPHQSDAGRRRLKHRRPAVSGRRVGVDAASYPTQPATEGGQTVAGNLGNQCACIRDGRTRPITGRPQSCLASIGAPLGVANSAAATSRGVLSGRQAPGIPAASSAASSVPASRGGDTGMPAAAMRCLAWYSKRSMSYVSAIA